MGNSVLGIRQQELYKLVLERPPRMHSKEVLIHLVLDRRVLMTLSLAFYRWCLPHQAVLSLIIQIDFH